MQIEIVILIVLGIWISVVSFVLYIYINLFKRLTKGTKEGNLKTVLESVLESQVKTKEELEKLKVFVKKLEKQTTFSIQKLGLVRFNPFDDLGGDHSFTLAVLDGRQNGIIITSLHSRERTRIYMKRVKNGKSEHELSKEEKESLIKAQNG